MQDVGLLWKTKEKNSDYFSILISTVSNKIYFIYHPFLSFLTCNDHQFTAKRIYKLYNLSCISRDNNSLEFYLKLAFLEKCKLVKTNESSGRVFFISNSFAQKRTLVMWFCWLHQNQINSYYRVFKRKT